jgi:hypothetical protein
MAEVSSACIFVSLVNDLSPNPFASLSQCAKQASLNMDESNVFTVYNFLVHFGVGNSE